MTVNVYRRVLWPLFLVLVLFSGQASAEKAKIVFAGRQTLDSAGGKAWQQAMDEYQKENPNVEFEYVGEANGTAYMEKLLVLTAAGTPPDVMHLYNCWIAEFGQKGLISTMPGDVLTRIKSNLHPQALIGHEYKGSQYGVPTEFQVTALMYNKTLLGEAGIRTIPATWAELAATVKRLLSAQPPEKKIGGMTFNGAGYGWTATWYTLATAYGASYANDAGDITLETPAALKVAEQIVEWFGQDKWANLDRVGFSSGKGYFGQGFPWFANQFGVYLGSNYYDTIGVTKMPAGPAGTGNYQYGWGLYVHNGSKQKTEAWKFIEWLATKPQFQGITGIGMFQKALGSLPTNRRELTMGAFAEQPTFWMPFIDNLETAVTEEKLPAGEQRQNLLSRVMGQLISLKITPQQALADITSGVKSLISGATGK